MSTPTKTRKTSSKLLTVFERAAIVTGVQTKNPQYTAKCGGENIFAAHKRRDYV